MHRCFWSPCVLCFVAAWALASAGWRQSLPADEQTPETTPSERDRWMAAKLVSSQQILEHLTRGDFDKLQTSARRMHVLNFLEQWAREEDFERKSDYQGQLNAFEFATKELIRHAGDQNTDGCLSSYQALTESCVRCHQLIRDVQSR